MICCDLKAHRECSCEPGECRAQHLGTFTKPRPIPASPSIKSQIAVGVFVAAISFVAFMTFTNHEANRARVDQEQIAWQR